MRNLKVSEVKITYMNETPKSERVKIGDAKAVYDVLKPYYDENMDYKEMSYAVYLNRENEILAVKKISEGGVSATVIDPKIVFQGALKLNASALIISHNHPSGNLKPSSADIKLTKDLMQGGKYLSIEVLDHLIITSDGYLSFINEGII